MNTLPPCDHDDALPAGLPPLPKNACYAGRLKDHERGVFGWIFDGRSDTEWKGPCEWSGVPKGYSSLWHVAETHTPEASHRTAMNKTPETDAIFESIRLANHPETDTEHFHALMGGARCGVEALEAERDDLAAWKESAMAVAAQCDIQAVGKLLGVPLGRDIYPAIEPGIRELQAKLDLCRKTLKQILEMHHEGPGEFERLIVLAIAQTEPAQP